MAGPSQAQGAAIAGLSGVFEGFGGEQEAADQAKKANALQMAIERRAEEQDTRNGLPPALAWKLALKTTGADPNTPMPPEFRSGRQLSQALLQSGTSMYNTENKKFAPPKLKDKHDTELKNARLYQQGLAAVKKALGEKFKLGLNKLTPEDAEMANAVFQGAVGPEYSGGKLMESTAGKPASAANKWTLGLFGEPAVPAQTKILAPDFGGATRPDAKAF